MRALLVSTSIFTFSLAAGAANAADEHGCFPVPKSCVSAEAEWRGNEFWVFYKNGCGGRVYIRYCHRREGRDPDCGEEGIPNGGRVSTWTIADATGEARWITVGSELSANDWVCSGKVDSWKQDMY